AGPHALFLTIHPDMARRGERRRMRSGYTTLPEQEGAREMCHRFLHYTMPHAPVWLRQGLCLYLESVEVENDTARFGHREPRLTNEVAAGRVIPIGLLVDAPASEYQNGADWWRDHQASAWAFVHFMVDGDEGHNRPR